MKKIVNLLAVLILLALLIVGLLPGIASASTVKDYYNTGYDGNSTFYGVYWEGQTFTTTTSYYVDRVVLNMFEVDLAGNITVSIRSTVGNLPIGLDLASGTYNLTTLGNNTSGNISVTMSPSIVLAAYNQYAIIISVSGNATSYAGWLADTTSPTYTKGSRVSSVNSGLTWSYDTTDDFMFAVWGDAWMPSPAQIEDAIVIPNVYENGDWYIGVHYNNVETGYPDGDCEALYSLVLFNGALDVAKVPCPAWGYMPGLIYISNLTKIGASLAWESNTIGIELRDNATGAAVYSYMLQPNDWKRDFKSVGSADLDKWVRETAGQQMETYYGIDLYTETIPTDSGNKTLNAGEGVLTVAGSQIFSNNMPGLDELSPYLFYMISHSPTEPHTAYSHTYSNTFDWQTRLGAQAVSDLNDAAAVINMPSGKTLAGGLMFAGYLVLAGIGVWKLGSPAIAIGAAVPFLIGGIWIGIIPVALGAILSLIMVIAFVWIVWLRST